MLEVSLGGVITAFVTVGLLGFFSLWAYYDRRDRLYYDSQRHRHSFHCVRCGQLYASRESKEKVPCSNCGFENASLRF